jgi:hypothetical protein
MLLRCLLPVVIFLSLSTASAQSSTALLHFNQKRIQTNKIGMITLASWALMNISTGAIAARQATGSNKHFHQMNAYWNVVNLALAGFSYYGSATADPATFDLFSSVNEHYGMEKILLLNAGLDAAYIATGLYLTERAKNSITHADRFKGFGQSVMLQGGFLLAFDVVMYFIHNSHVPLLRDVLGNISFTGSTLAMVIRF